MDERIIKDIINHALWAPTPDNMQNWNISNKNGSYKIEPSAEIKKHPLDQFDNCLVISMGMFLEHLIIIAENNNYKVTWSFDTKEGKLEFTFKKQEIDSKNELEDVIKKRRTNRYFYQKDFSQTTNIGIIKKELNHTNNDYKTEVHFLNEQREDLLRYLKACESIFFRFFDAINETIKWINFKNLKLCNLSLYNYSLNRIVLILLIDTDSFYQNFW